MIVYRKLTREDFDDISELCKDIWDGTDYLPEIFHKWVDDSGLFLGAVDTTTNKVIGTDKYSLLHDGTGWLEGLRTHKDYRGRGIGKELALKLFEKALSDLQNNTINKIAFSTHISSVESIGMMKQLNFKLEQEYIFVDKPYGAAGSGLDIRDFSVEGWSPSFEDFKGLTYLSKRNNLLPFVFYFQEPTPELHQELINEGCFITINGHRGLFKLKGEPHFIVFDESLEGIDAFMNYYLLLLDRKCGSAPLTSILPSDTGLMAALKASGYNTMSSWLPDYLYFTYKSSR